MKHAYLITDTAYKMFYQVLFLEIMYRCDIRRNVQHKITDVNNIEIWKDVFKNLSPNLNTHDFGCAADTTCRSAKTWCV